MGIAIADAKAEQYEAELRARLVHADRACCCPARPAVVAIIPPAAGRPNGADLLLCGHHYRSSRAALLAVGACVHDLRLLSGA
jgi:hypothetical protein